MVAAPGGPDGCKGTDRAPWARVATRGVQGCLCRAWQYSSCVMRPAAGNTHWACQVLTLMHPTLHAPSALCGVPSLCRHQYLQPHQCLNAFAHNLCADASAHVNASVHSSPRAPCPSAALPATSSQALMQLQPRRQALEDQVQYACMELLEDDEVCRSVGRAWVSTRGYFGRHLQKVPDCSRDMH